MLRYYPSFAITANLNTQGAEFVLNGQNYSGSYYETYDGRAFTGPNPEQGPNQELQRIPYYASAPGLDNLNLSARRKRQIAETIAVGESTTLLKKKMSAALLQKYLKTSTTQL